MFALDYLTFSKSAQLDHLELFAGDCAVTRGEIMDSGKRPIETPSRSMRLDLNLQVCSVVSNLHTQNRARRKAAGP